VHVNQTNNIVKEVTQNNKKKNNIWTLHNKVQHKNVVCFVCCTSPTFLCCTLLCRVQMFFFLLFGVTRSTPCVYLLCGRILLRNVLTKLVWQNLFVLYRTVCTVQMLVFFLLLAPQVDPAIFTRRLLLLCKYFLAVLWRVTGRLTSGDNSTNDTGSVIQ